MKKYFLLSAAVISPMRFYILIGFMIFLNSSEVFPQWTQSNVLTFYQFNCFAGTADNMFAGNVYRAYRSTDEGLNWSPVNNGMENVCIISFYKKDSFLFAGTASNSGSNGSVYLSTNDGALWTQVSDLWSASPVFAINSNSNYIFAATTHLDNGTGRIYRSSNNGTDWTLVYDMPISPFTDIEVDNNNIFVSASLPLGSQANLFRSTDNGTTWNILNNNIPSLSIRSLEIDGGKLYAGSSSGLYVSTDNGSNWQFLHSMSNANFRVNGNFILAYPYVSTDAGSTWQTIETLPHQISSMKMIGDKLYAGTISNGIWFRSLAEFTPVELTSFSASASFGKIELKWETASELNNSGFEILKSTDNSSWYSIGFIQGNGTTTNANKYSYTDNTPHLNKSFYQLKQIDLDGTYSLSKIIEVDFSTVNEFNLAQNYPNPFNPYTIIRYSVGGTAESMHNVSLKVFDVLGNETAELVNESKSTGDYEVSFISTKYNLPSGVYLYKLTVDDYTSVRRMLLLK